MPTLAVITKSLGEPPTESSHAFVLLADADALGTHVTAELVKARSCDADEGTARLVFLQSAVAALAKGNAFADGHAVLMPVYVTAATPTVTTTPTADDADVAKAKAKAAEVEWPRDLLAVE
jgi:hypothetical protein